MAETDPLGPDEQKNVQSGEADALERDVISRNRLWIPTNRVL